MVGGGQGRDAQATPLECGCGGGPSLFWKWGGGGGPAGEWGVAPFASLVASLVDTRL